MSVGHIIKAIRDFMQAPQACATSGFRRPCTKTSVHGECQNDYVTMKTRTKSASEMAQWQQLLALDG